MFKSWENGAEILRFSYNFWLSPSRRRRCFAILSPFTYDPHLPGAENKRGLSAKRPRKAWYLLMSNI